MAPLNVVGYGSIQERISNGHEIDLTKNNSWNVPCMKTPL